MNALDRNMANIITEQGGQSAFLFGGDAFLEPEYKLGKRNVRGG